MANMFDENGNYNKTEWKPGDRITAGKLNKIEESLEAINNNDIERHKEADERLDALEEQKEAVNDRFDELEDLVADNKSEVEVLIYENNVKMDRLEQEMNDGIDTVEAIAHTVDDKIAEADASMKAQVAEAEDIVDQGKADMEAMVAEVEGDLEVLYDKYDELSVQLERDMSKFGLDPDNFYGTDTEKLQQAIDYILNNDIGEIPIIIGRKYTVIETLKLNRNGKTNKSMIEFRGASGELYINFDGFLFSSDDEKTEDYRETGDLMLKDLVIRTTNDVTIFDQNSLIRTYLYDCNLYNIYKITKSSTYIQTLYIRGCRIYGNRGSIEPLIYQENGSIYDLNVTDNVIEWIGTFLKTGNASLNGVRVTNNLIEGIAGSVWECVGDSVTQSVVFDGNYFESNERYFDLTLLKTQGCEISNSYVWDTNTSKIFAYLPINAFGSTAALDTLIFSSNAINGGLKNFEFKSSPHSEVKVRCYGFNGNPFQHDNIEFMDNSPTSKTLNDKFKIYKKGFTECVVGNFYNLFQDGGGNQVITIPTGVNLSDFIIDIRVKYDSDTINKLNNVKINNYYSEGDKLYVAVTNIEGMYGATFEIKAIKIIKTDWF